MIIGQFADIEAEFMTRVSQAVYCIMTTVDRQNRPRSRVMHPIWDGPIGWVISRPDSYKASHLAFNPAISLAYIPTKEKPVYVDGFAEWVGAVEEKQRIWDLHCSTPPPLGFDPQPHFGSIHHPYYGLLRITPRRIELADLFGESMVWRVQRT